MATLLSNPVASGGASYNRDHPEFNLAGPRTMFEGHPQVRRRGLMQIEELCTKWDVDGIELLASFPQMFKDPQWENGANTERVHGRCPASGKRVWREAAIREWPTRPSRRNIKAVDRVSSFIWGCVLRMRYPHRLRYCSSSFTEGLSFGCRAIQRADLGDKASDHDA